MKRDLALIYLRRSLTIRGKADQYSKQRQESSCLALAKSRGLRTRVFQDFLPGHHYSGTSDRHRPGWMALKQELNNPDVACVIVEQLSRSYRSVRHLLEFLDLELAPRKISLVVASMPSVDFSTVVGRSQLISLAAADEMYARMNGQTMALAIASFAAAGRGWGAPVYGLTSQGKGYERILMRSDLGVWWKGEPGEGECRDGTEGKSPGRGWTFRGDFDAAVSIWKKFVSEDVGVRRLADFANSEGYRFQSSDDRKRRPFDSNNVRSVLDSWIIYRGYVRTGRRSNQKIVAKARFEPLADRKLLDLVSVRIKQRSFRRMNHGLRKRQPLLMQGVLRCGKCGSAYYSDPGRKETHTPHYYHFQRKCDEQRYYRVEELDVQLLDFLDRMKLSNEEIERIVNRDAAPAGKPDRHSERKVQMARLARELRSIGLDEDRIKLQLASVEAGLREEEAPVLPAAPVMDKEAAARRLKKLGALIERRRKDQPVEVNQAVRALFQYIKVKKGKLKFHPHAWAAAFFR